MKPAAQAIRTFTEKHPFLGPIAWMVSVQYFIVQAIVAATWSGIAYSWADNTISDLGNTVCGLYGDRLVCSPLSWLMNASFIVLGVTMMIGALLIYEGFARRTRLSLVGFTFMGLAGLGSLLVGLFPENVMGNMHIVGATLALFIGNLGLVVLSMALDIPKGLKYYTLASGLVSLLALLLFVMQVDLGLGIGGMERLAGYPQTLWLIVFGVYISEDRIRHLS